MSERVTALYNKLECLIKSRRSRVEKSFAVEHVAAAELARRFEIYGGCGPDDRYER